MRQSSQQTTVEPAPPAPVEPGWRPVLALLLTVTLAAATVLALNHEVNPRAEFAPNHFRPLIEEQATVKLAFYDALPEAPRALVLGSSRAMQIHPADVEAAFGVKDAFNFAFYRAAPSESLAVFRYVAATARAPDHLVVGLELDQVAQADAPRAFVTASPKLGPHAGEARDAAATAARLAQSFDPRYFWDTLRVLWYNTLGEYPVAGNVVDENVIDADGAFHLTREEVARAAGTFNLSARLDPAGVAARLARIEGLDAGALAHVQALAQTARESGTQVHLFLTPHHPALAQRLAGTSYDARHEALVQAVRELCAPGVSVHDFTRIDAFNGTADAFYDAVHPARENGARIVQALARGQGDVCAT